SGLSTGTVIAGRVEDAEKDAVRGGDQQVGDVTLDHPPPGGDEIFVGAHRCRPWRHQLRRAPLLPRIDPLGA
ncbi:hypothetical protein ACSTKL_23530, partial [Vibrio parahaemolyticus]